MSRISVLVLLIFAATQQVLASELERAEFNYIMFCQGCHLPDAMGTTNNSVPRINNHIGHFLQVEGGREYLARVPGVANAAIDDEQLAELMNWLIINYSGQSMPVHFKPYTKYEIAGLRVHPLNEVVERRKLLVEKINTLPTQGVN